MLATQAMPRLLPMKYGKHTVSNKDNRFQCKAFRLPAAFDGVSVRDTDCQTKVEAYKDVLTECTAQAYPLALINLPHAKHSRKHAHRHVLLVAVLLLFQCPVQFTAWFVR